MDIWVQVYLYAYWNKQMNRSITAKIAACPKGRRFFHAKMEESQMKGYLRGHSFMNLFPSGEIQETEIAEEYPIELNNKAV